MIKIRGDGLIPVARKLFMKKSIAIAFQKSDTASLAFVILLVFII